MTQSVKVLGRIGEYDVEILLEIDEGDYGSLAGMIAEMTKQGIAPRPRFQGNGPKVELPFTGVIDKTELMPAKDGKKEYCLAHVKHDDGTLVPVRYFPPQKTWRAGEKVKVQKGSYGPELKELDDDDSVPF